MGIPRGVPHQLLEVCLIGPELRRLGHKHHLKIVPVDIKLHGGQLEFEVLPELVAQAACRAGIVPSIPKPFETGRWVAVEAFAGQAVARGRFMLGISGDVRRGGAVHDVGHTFAQCLVRRHIEPRGDEFEEQLDRVVGGPPPAPNLLNLQDGIQGGAIMWLAGPSREAERGLGANDLACGIDRSSVVVHGIMAVRLDGPSPPADDLCSRCGVRRPVPSIHCSTYPTLSLAPLLFRFVFRMGR